MFNLYFSYSITIFLFANVFCGPFDNLNATAKQNLTNRLTGCLAPSIVNPGSNKGLDDMKNLFNGILSQISYSAGPLVQKQLQNYSQFAVNSIGSFNDIMVLNATLYDFISKLNGSYANTIPPNLIQNYMFKMINMDTFIPNLDVSTKFWNDFENRLLSNSTSGLWYRSFKQNLTQTQINALSIALEVPNIDSVRINLMDSLASVLASRPTIVNEFENSFLNPDAKWNEVQLTVLQPILKQMTCFYLRKIDFNDLFKNWINGSRIDFQSFDKLCKCNMLFVFNASQSGQIMDSALKSVTADYMVKYMLLLGQSNPEIIIDRTGSNILTVASTTLEKVLNLNVSATAILFSKYNFKQNFLTFKKDWRIVISNAVYMYLSSIRNRNFTQLEIDMFLTTIFDMPFENAAILMDLNDNYKILLSVTDNLPKQFWLDNRDLCNKYFDYLSNKSIVLNDPLVTMTRLKQLVPCRDNCDFSKLIFNKTNAFSVDLAKQLIPVVDSQIVCSCQKSLGMLLKNCMNSSVCNQNEIYQSTNNLTVPLCAVFNPNEVKTLPINVISGISGSLANTQIDSQTAKNMFRKLPQNATASVMGNLIIGASIDYITSQSDQNIANISPIILKNCDGIDSIKLSLLLKKYLNYSFTQNNLKQAVLNVINTNNDKCLQSIDVNQFKKANISENDASPESLNRLPKNLLFSYSKQQTSFNTLNSTNCKNYSLNSASLTDLKQLTNKSEIIDLVSNLNTNEMNSFRLKYVYDAVIGDGAKYNTSNPFAYLTDSMVDKIDPLLFIDISSDNLTLLSKSPIFGTILKKLATIPKDKCVNFPAAAVKAFIEIAMQYLNLKNKPTLNSTDLDALGPFLSVRLPVKYINIIDSKSFFSRIDYFKSICFQLNASDASFFSNYSGNAYTQQKPSLSKLLELSIYLPSTILNSVPKTELSSNAANCLNAIQNQKDNSTEKVKNERKISGLSSSDDNDNKVRIQNTLKTFVQSSSLTGKRKRQTSQLTCSSISSQTSSTGYGASSFSVSDLISLTQTDFENCLYIFGNASNNWDDSYINEFYQKIKSSYPNLNQIPSTVISDLGIIAYKFSPSELAQLKLLTLEPISNLGKLDGFTSDQMYSIVTNIMSNGLSVTNSNSLISMGNLVCGISSNDVSSIPITTFNDALVALSAVTAINCGNLNSWWSLAKQANASNLIYTREYISIIGSIASGMSVSELNTNMDADKVNALSLSALKIMPDALKTEIKNNPTLSSGLEPSQQATIGMLDKSNVLSTSLQSSAFSVFSFNPIIFLITIAVILL